MKKHNTIAVSRTQSASVKRAGFYSDVPLMGRNVRLAGELSPKGSLLKFWLNQYIYEKLQEDVCKKDARAKKGVVQLDKCNMLWVEYYCPEDRKGDIERWFNEMLSELLDTVDRVQHLAEDRADTRLKAS